MKLLKIFVLCVLVFSIHLLFGNQPHKFKVTDKKTVVPKDTARYRSFPSIIKIKGNHLLMAYRDGHSLPNVKAHGIKGDTRLIEYKNGKWSSSKLLYEHEGDRYEEMAGDLSILKDGTIFIFSRQWNDEANGKPHDSYIAKSTDHGKTFTPRKALHFDEFQKYFTPFGKIIELEDGTLLMGAYGTKKGDTRSSSGCIISKDHGETWQFGSWIALNNSVPRVEFNEVFILKLPSKKLFAIMRTENGYFYTTHSQDNGKPGSFLKEHLEEWLVPDWCFHPEKS